MLFRPSLGLWCGLLLAAGCSQALPGTMAGSCGPGGCGPGRPLLFSRLRQPQTMQPPPTFQQPTPPPAGFSARSASVGNSTSIGAASSTSIGSMTDRSTSIGPPDVEIPPTP